MSKSKLQQSLDALVATTDDDLEPVEISTGTVYLAGASVFDVIVLSRKYVALRGLFTGATETVVDEDDEKAREAANRQAGKAFMDALIGEGPEALASFIAICARQKKNMDVAIAAILDKSQDDIDLLLDAAIEKTMPTGASDFFGRVGRIMGKLGLQGPTESPNGSTAAAA